MLQSGNGTGIDPAACRTGPSRRPEKVDLHLVCGPVHRQLAYGRCGDSRAGGERGAQCDRPRERERCGREPLGAEATGDLRLGLAVDPDVTQGNAERGAGDLIAGDNDGAANGSGPADDVVAESECALGNAEAGHRSRGNLPGAAGRPGWRGGCSGGQGQRRRGRLLYKNCHGRDGEHRDHRNSGENPSHWVACSR